jgi:hypothetical protein
MRVVLPLVQMTGYLECPARGKGFVSEQRLC